MNMKSPRAVRAQLLASVPRHISTDLGLKVTSLAVVVPRVLTQCPAVMMVSLDRIDPPHKNRPSIVRRACHTMLGLPPAVAAMLAGTGFEIEETRET